MKACVILGALLHSKLDEKTDTIDIVLRFVCDWALLNGVGPRRTTPSARARDLMLGTQNARSTVTE
jgi:hypothetical protein